MREEKKECCGTCKHHKRPWIVGRLTEWICENEGAENYGLATEYGDFCIDYEERE